MPILAQLCIYCKHFSSTRGLNRYLVGFCMEILPPQNLPQLKILKILLWNQHQPQLMWFSAQSMDWARLFKLLLITLCAELWAAGVREAAGHKGFPKTAQWGCPEIPLGFGNSVGQQLLLCTTATEGITDTTLIPTFAAASEMLCRLMCNDVFHMKNGGNDVFQTRKSGTPCGAEVTSYNPMNFLWKEFSPDLCLLCHFVLCLAVLKMHFFCTLS